MLVPKVDIREFEKFGFKPCRGNTKNSKCYYLCVARGCRLMGSPPPTRGTLSQVLQDGLKNILKIE